MSAGPGVGDEPHYAGFVSRSAAFVVDTFVIATLGTVGALLASATTDALFPTRRGVEVGPGVLGIVLWATALVYRAFFWSVVGSTPAMWLFGLHLVTTSGERVGVARAVVRFLAYAASALAFGLGYAWVLVDRRHQAWHDKIARTVVLYSERRPRRAPGPPRTVVR